MLLPLFLVQVLTAPPSPQQTPLKEITHVTSSPMCTAIRNDVAPSVTGFIVNDRVIESGKGLLVQLGHDVGHDAFYNRNGYTDQPILSGLDVMRIGNTVESLVCNLERLDDMANDPIFDNGEARLKTDIGSAVDFSEQGRGPAPQVGSAPVWDDPSHLFDAGISRTPGGGKDPTLTNSTAQMVAADQLVERLGPFAAAVEFNQLRTSHAETDLSTSIVAAANECGRKAAAPANSPAP